MTRVEAQTAAARARAVAAAAAYSGAGLSVLAGSAWGLVRVEAQLARRAIGNADGVPPAPSGWYGQGRPGPALRIALLGDSSAAGYGVEAVEQTPGAILASGLAEAADRRVHLVSVARVGAQSKDLDDQIDRVLPDLPDLAVVFIGANDVTHAVPIRASVRLLDAAVRRLRRAGVQVVIATCPDLGTVEPLAPPLRQLARAWSRRLAASQATTALEAGASTVAMASILTPEFQLSDALFGPDRFHPSAVGYARMASVVLPTVLVALGVSSEAAREPEYDRGEALLPIDLAVLEATRHPGASIEPVAEEQAPPAGAFGRFVMLRRRRRHPGADVEQPAAEET